MSSNAIIASNLGMINIKSYGAVGDGTADDTASIQLACNAASDAGAIPVYVPPGIYKVTSTINLYGSMFGAYSGRQVYRGGGTAFLTANNGLSTIYSTISDGSPAIKVDGVAIEARSDTGGKQGRINPIFKDFCIYGDGNNTDGLVMDGSTSGGGLSNWRMENLQVYDCQVGISTWGWTGMVLHCFCLNNRETSLFTHYGNAIQVIGGEYGIGAFSQTVRSRRTSGRSRLPATVALATTSHLRTWSSRTPVGLLA